MTHLKLKLSKPQVSAHLDKREKERGRLFLLKYSGHKTGNQQHWSFLQKNISVHRAILRDYLSKPRNTIYFHPFTIFWHAITDKACYIYTSGTTGLPKACNIKHVRYFSLQQGVNLMAEIHPDDIVYCTLPLYHTNGGMLSSGQMLFTGATLVIRKKFSASNFWLDCIKYKCTVSYIEYCDKPIL